MTSPARYALLSLVAFAPLALAQDAPPGPAPELKKLEPMIGHWTGSGTALMDPAAGPSKWNSQSTYQWCLGNHFVQEDTYITFDGMPQPMVFRGYLGWDRENGRYISIAITNSGEAKLNEMTFLPDGTILQIMRQEKGGMAFAERTRSKIDGDQMSFAIDFLMPEGPSMEVVTGTFAKAPTGRAIAMDASFMAEPTEQMQKLCRMAGTYDVKGELVMAPGMEPMKITGTDKVTAIFQGAVLHVHTTGAAEGMDDTYEADGFQAWDPVKKCFMTVFVSNMGEVGTMETRWSPDGKLISTGSTLYMGQPSSQRFIVDVDASGALIRGVGHTLLGAAPPFQSFSATYTKK